MKSVIITATVLAFGLSMGMAQGPSTSGTGAPSPGAGGKKRHNPEEMFKKLDTNNDGSLSLDEFKAGPRAQKNPDRADKMFRRLDSDNNGSLSLDEFQTKPAPGGKKGANGAGGPHERKHQFCAPKTSGT